jgi:hypothetical protein
MVTSLVTWRTVFCSYALGAGYAGGGVSLGVSVCFSWWVKTILDVLEALFLKSLAFWNQLIV